MKLFSAAGVEDLSKGYKYTQYAKDFMGGTDLITYNANNGYIPTQSASQGLLLRQYMASCAIPLRDIIDDGGVDQWIALGLMVEPVAGQALPNGNSYWMALGSSDATSVATYFTPSRDTVLNTWGAGVRQCHELVFNPNTGKWNFFVNGILRDTGTINMDASWKVLSSLRTWYFNFMCYQTAVAAGVVALTDFYLARVADENAVLGNFKVGKLVSKQTTLPAAATTLDGVTATVTGSHSVEFDVTSLAGKTVHGIVENVRAASVGPTAGISATRRLNGVDSAANKVTNIPIALPSGNANSAQHSRLGAKATDFVAGTPVTEFKVNLTVVDNV